MWLCASAAHTGCVSACVWESESKADKDVLWIKKVSSSMSGLIPLNLFSLFESKLIIASVNDGVIKKKLQQWCNAHTKITPTVISSVPLYPSVLPFIFFHFGHGSVWATVGQTLIVHQWHQERISEFFYCECKYPRSSPKMADQLKKQQKNCL